MALSISNVCLGRHLNIRVGLEPVNMFKTSSIFTGRSKAVLHLLILIAIYVLCLSLLICTVCLVIRLERADLLALLCVVFSHAPIQDFFQGRGGGSRPDGQKTV